MTFQFHKGTIRTCEHYANASSFANFNSIKVQLERNNLDLSHVLCCNFNSIKVQLEHLRTCVVRSMELFQFHKGTIRTLNMICISLVLSDFNSIKVQLELSAIGSIAGGLLFQFHKGTIRTFHLTDFKDAEYISIP